jgi:hypothetical protein
VRAGRAAAIRIDIGDARRRQQRGAQGIGAADIRPVGAVRHRRAEPHGADGHSGAGVEKVCCLKLLHTLKGRHHDIRFAVRSDLCRNGAGIAELELYTTAFVAFEHRRD